MRSATGCLSGRFFRTVVGGASGAVLDQEASTPMSIGFGIFLFAIGAICAFALNLDLGWIEITTVGYILMAAGAVVTIIGIALLARRRSISSTERTQVDPASGTRVTQREASAPDDPRV
ncbi:DUF6458 family protein [Microbacterium limosum]|uniref:DUF6458 family protein n=1 Tax=Microbacterium limosum TaxID=3079935 RepID=A0AAU0MGV0_9MICO|nr:DUF6458 family protein [Microbacterium sp. Y20]WOQ69815.1 DUF6458 family protein [Microbacterium sp. Y20]